MSGRFYPPDEWGLTVQEARLVGALINAPGYLTHHSLLLALYDHPRSVDPELIKVLVCKARRKLTPFHVEIETIYGRGYFIADTVKDALRTGGEPQTRPPEEIPPALAKLLTTAEEVIARVLFASPSLASREAICAALREAGFSSDPRAPDKPICLLRPKLLSAGFGIETAHKRGWRLKRLREQAKERAA